MYIYRETERPRERERERERQRGGERFHINIRNVTIQQVQILNGSSENRRSYSSLASVI